MDGRPTGSSSVTSSPPSLFASHTLVLFVGEEGPSSSSTAPGPSLPSAPPRITPVIFEEDDDDDARIISACIVLSVSSIPITNFPSTFTAVPLCWFESVDGRSPNDGMFATFPKSVTRSVSIMRSACRRDRPRCLDSREENLTPPPEEEEPSGADFDFDFDFDDDDDDDDGGGGDDASTFPFAFFRPPRRCGGRRRRSSITDDDDAVIVDDDDDARRRRSANECCCGCGCGGGRATTTRTDDGDGIILLRDAAPAMVIAMDRCMILWVEALVGFGRFQACRPSRRVLK